MRQFSQIYKLGYCQVSFSQISWMLTKLSICIAVDRTGFGLLCVDFSKFTTQKWPSVPSMSFMRVGVGVGIEDGDWEGIL